jgi:glycosyltransferase involved in cell wall biosynthesis
MDTEALTRPATDGELLAPAGSTGPILFGFGNVAAGSPSCKREDKAVPPADISVVIPCFDRTVLALDTVRSVLAQSTPVREIIVVVNGSDEHAAFWRANAGGIVRVIRVPPLGQQAARTRGIEAATSRWVALLDDDDIYLPDFIESILPAIEDGRADVIGTDHRKFRGDRVDGHTNFEAAPFGYWRGIKPRDPKVQWSFLGRFPLKLLLRRIPFYASMTVIKRDLALTIGGFDPLMRGIRSEDIEFLVRAMTYGNLSLVWRPVVHYRLHPGNQSGDHNARVIGKWRVFEFIRTHHQDLPEDFRRALDRDLPRRRHDIANLARKAGDTDLFAEVWSQLHPIYRIPGLRPMWGMLLRMVRRLRRARQLAARLS